jgi:SAM-dependent methyltransferase
VSERADRQVAANVRGYRRAAPRYERLHGEIFNAREQARLRGALEQMLADLDSSGERPPRVLDFGCGSGNVTQHLLELGATVLAADLSPDFLALVRRRFDGCLLETLQLNGRDLDGLADAAVDAAVSYSVLHHIPDYLHAVRELCRVVRPGGVLQIDHEAAPNEYADDAVLAEFRGRVYEHELARPKRASRFLDPWHYRTLGRHYLMQLRRRFGNPRHWPEGDIHVWPDDHIEWDAIERVLREERYQVVASEDYLLYREGTAEELYEHYRHLTADVRMVRARRART